MAETIETLGNLGEFVGAIAIVVTLVYLSIQVRHSRSLIEANSAAMEENTRLVKAAAMDRYNDVVSRWRGRLIENEEVAKIWDNALRGQSVEGSDALRLENLWIDWINTYRSNFSRATAVGQEGLKHQAVLSVVLTMREAPIFLALWEWARPFNEASSEDFVESIDRELAKSGGLNLSISPLRSEDSSAGSGNG
jgi:hypothetical protein